MPDSRLRVHDRDFGSLVLAGGADSEYSEQVVAHAAQLGLGSDLRTFFNLPPACLPSLYAASDVFVSPADSPSESFGLTIVEAMACGRPVVASDWDGYKDTVRHGEDGFRIPTYAPPPGDGLGRGGTMTPPAETGRRQAEASIRR